MSVPKLSTKIKESVLLSHVRVKWDMNENAWAIQYVVVGDDPNNEDCWKTHVRCNEEFRARKWGDELADNGKLMRTRYATNVREVAG